MKETVKTIVREFDDKGNIIKETEIISEKEYKYPYIPITYNPPYPSIYPQYTYLTSPDYKPSITCNCKAGE